MTGRTHDLTAFTALSYIVAAQPEFKMTFATMMVAIGANLIGGLAPDIDQPTADLWNRIPAGTIIGRILYPILGGHRYISHSILGVFLFGWLLHLFLQSISHILLVDMNIVWWAFMIGFISHLIADFFTVEGVPLLFPIPFKFGFPPFKFMRIKTGGLVEKSIVFPGLMVLCGYIYYSHYHKFLDILRHYIK